MEGVGEWAVLDALVVPIVAVPPGFREVDAGAEGETWKIACCPDLQEGGTWEWEWAVVA